MRCVHVLGARRIAQARYARELPDAYERLILDVINVRANQT
jgi:hypothetical protein